MNDLSASLSLEDSFEELLSPEKDLRKGWLIAAGFFVVLLGWAALTPLDAGAMAQGVVAVSGNRQAVQHRDGGVVTAINVSEGQLVKKGDLLVTISALELVAAEKGMAGEVANLLAMRSRLEAERDGKGTMVRPAEFEAMTQQDLVLAEEAFHGQKSLFDARRRSIASERDIIGQQIQQYRSQIGSFEHQREANRIQQGLIGDELKGMQELAERGFVAKNRIRAMEREAARLDGDFGAYNSEIARSSEAIGEARMQSVSIERRTIEDAATQLREVQVRLDEVMPKLAATREQLKASMLRAPATGKVVGLSIFTVGGVVGPGEKLMEIVPNNRALVVEAKASPNDADDIKIGMETQVRFSALQEKSIPILNGKVSKISADSLEDERSGERFFMVEVTVPPSEMIKIAKIRNEAPLKAGLPAEVMIPLRKRTALQYLLEPLTQMLWRTGREN